jgi:hypothetical protein
MRRLMALVLCGSLIGSGCASGHAPRSALPAPQKPARRGMDPVLMAEYVRELPVGSKVRIDRASGGTVHAVLMKNDRDPIVVQRRARIPEAPIAIAIDDIVAMELETGHGSAGRTAAIAAAAAAGATLGVLLVLAALLSD